MGTTKSSLALGSGLVILALLGTCGCLGLRGQPGPGATPSSTSGVQVTLERVSLRVGWRKDFRTNTPSMGVGSGLALTCQWEGLHLFLTILHVVSQLLGVCVAGEGHSMLVTWAPPEAPALSCMEFQGAVSVALRGPRNLAGEAGYCCCDGIRPPHLSGGGGCPRFSGCHQHEASRVAPCWPFPPC